MKYWFCLISFGLLFPAFASEMMIAEKYNNLRSDPVALRSFLTHFPKGADLHNHIDGAIYAENMIKWAAEDGRCVDLASYEISLPPCDRQSNRSAMSNIANNRDIVSKIIDAYSMRNFNFDATSGADHFFATFGLFYVATFGREGDMLDEVTLRAERQNIHYLELMQSWGMGDARQAAKANLDHGKLDDATLNKALDNIVITTRKLLDDAEQRRRKLQQCDNPEKARPACDVKTAYLAQVIRVFSQAEVRAQTRLAVKLIQQDPRIIGLNFVAPEDHPTTLKDHDWQMAMVAEETAILPVEQRNISLHAGELTFGLVPPEVLGTHIRQAIEIAKAKRIGHGIDIIYDDKADQLLKRMAKEKIAVEINLTSNASILGVAGNSHPFTLYRKYHVPLTLSTDDEGVSRIDLTHEYQRAIESYHLSYAEIKELSRNALRYSFQPGISLFSVDNSAKLIKQCQQTEIEKQAQLIFKTNKAFWQKNLKARMQCELERRFVNFEANFQSE